LYLNKLVKSNQVSDVASVSTSVDVYSNKNLSRHFHKIMLRSGFSHFDSIIIIIIEIIQKSTHEIKNKNKCSYT